MNRNLYRTDEIESSNIRNLVVLNVLAMYPVTPMLKIICDPHNMVLKGREEKKFIKREKL